MKYIRLIAVWMLAGLLMCAPVWAEELSEEGERQFLAVSEEMPEDIILSAMEIYSWFTISPLDVDWELPSEDGSVWRVADEVLCDYETMMRLLDFSFSPEVVAEMLAFETYTVIDGCLYGTAAGRPVDPLISEVIYEETERSEERVVYTVTVNYLGEGENAIEPHVLEFIREPVNGLWVFTQFPFFW